MAAKDGSCSRRAAFELDARDGQAGQRRCHDSDLLRVVVGGLDPLARRGLAAILNDDRQLEAIVSDLDDLDLERLVARELPSLVILDEPPRQSESAVLLSLWPAIGIVVVTHKPTSSYGLLLLAAGLTCLPWNVSTESLLRAVRLTAKGGCMFVSGDGDTVVRHDRSTGSILTPREIEVLARLSEGQSPAVIALELRISVETVRTHTTHLRRKLNVRSARELVGLRLPPTLRSR